MPECAESSRRRVDGVLATVCRVPAELCVRADAVGAIPSKVGATNYGRGQFTIKGVPPGEYIVSVWHEAASKLLEKKIRVTDGTQSLSLVIDADKAPTAFLPDKSGKLRQPQLGY